MDKYHFFSDVDYAGPGPLDLLKFWDKGGYTLRTCPRKLQPTCLFPDSSEGVIAELAIESDSKEIANFWNNYYKGHDWRFHCSWADVDRWLKSGFILTIKRESKIVGTFVCRFIQGVYCGKFNKQAILLEGLVLAPWLRGEGLASFLLASMDYIVYNRPELSQSIAIWFREQDNKFNAILQNPISILDYSYVKIADIQKKANRAVKAKPETVKAIVNSIAEKTRHLFTLVSNDTQDLDVYWHLAENSLIGIAFTHRIGSGDYTIWEVVYASNTEEPFFDNLQVPIEMAALELPCARGLLFASNGLSRGNLANPYRPWVRGTSGSLTTHLYNWMPPKFFNGDILFPRSCI